MRECPRCGAQLRCHRADEFKSDVSAQMNHMYELFEQGDHRSSKKIANNIALKNRQYNLPGVDDDLKIFFKKLKTKRAEAKKTSFVL